MSSRFCTTRDSLERVWPSSWARSGFSHTPGCSSCRSISSSCSFLLSKSKIPPEHGLALFQFFDGVNQCGEFHWYRSRISILRSASIPEEPSAAKDSITDPKVPAGEMIPQPGASADSRESAVHARGRSAGLTCFNPIMVHYSHKRGFEMP